MPLHASFVADQLTVGDSYSEVDVVDPLHDEVEVHLMPSVDQELHARALEHRFGPRVAPAGERLMGEVAFGDVAELGQCADGPAGEQAILVPKLPAGARCE